MTKWRLTLDFQAGDSITDAIEAAENIDIPTTFRPGLDERIDAFRLQEVIPEGTDTGGRPLKMIAVGRGR